MTRIKVREIVWDDWNVIHISKHNVTKDEVTIAVVGFIYHKRTYNGRYLLVGRAGKRIVSVVVRREKETTYYIVTARDADKKERRRVYEKESKK